MKKFHFFLWFWGWKISINSKNQIENLLNLLRQFFRKINQKSFSQKFNSGLIQRKFNSIRISFWCSNSCGKSDKKRKVWIFDEKKAKKCKKTMKFSRWEILRKKSEKKWKKENRPRKLSKNYAPFNSNLIQKSSSKNFSVLPWTL